MLIEKILLPFINKVNPFNKYHLAFLLQHKRYRELLFLLNSNAIQDKSSDLKSGQKHKRTIDLNHLILSIYSYLGLKDYSSTKTILKEIETHYSKYVSVELNFIYAYLFLIENKKVLAIEKYLTLIHHKKYGQQAKKILRLIKERDNVQEILLQYTKLTFFLPPIKKYTHLWRRLYFVYLTSLAIALLFFFYWNPIGDKIRLRSTNLSSNRILFEKKENKKVNLKDHYLLEHLSDQNDKKKWLEEIEAREKYRQMKKYLYDKKVNSAIIIYNQVMQYDLTLPLEEQFDVLYKSIPRVDFYHFENTYSFQDIFSTNYIFYLNTYLKYRGIISNIKQDKGIITFFFTIVKQKGNLVEDIVEVYIDSKDLRLQAGEYYNLLGKVKGYAKNKKKIIVEGLILEPTRD